MKQLLELLMSLFGKQKETVTIEKTPEESLKPYIEENTNKDPNPIEFKTIRVNKEWVQLKVKNPELYKIIEEVDNFVWKKYKKNIVITMIFRTESEQDYLYRDSKKYAKKKFRSPHQFWQGVDLRTWTFTDKEIKEITDFANKKQKGNYYKWVAKAHTVGKNGKHFHFQYVKS